MRIDKPLAIVIPVLIVLAIVLAAVLPWRCSAQTAGTAGTIDFSRDYSAKLDEIMTEQHGADWKRLVPRTGQRRGKIWYRPAGKLM